MSAELIRHILGEMFSWPGGNVVGNLLASALTGTIVYLKLHFKMNKQHKERMDKMDAQHAEHMAAVNELTSATRGRSA